MTNLFTYVSNDNISSFLENESNYLDKIAFLGDTKKIRTKGHEYGGDHGNSKIFYGTCNTVAATTEKAVICNDFTEDDLVDGVMVITKFTYTNSGAIASLTLNVNETGAYNIKKIYATSSSNAGLKDISQVGEIYADAPIPFIFNGTYWVIAGVDININSQYTLNYSIDAGQYKAGNGNYAVTRYSLLLQKPDWTWEKTTATSAQYTTATSKSVNTNGFLLNQIRYYNTTAAKANGALIATNTCNTKAASVDMRYSTNCGGTPGWNVGDYIYLVGSLHSDSLFYLDTTQWWSNALPTTNDGKLYIRLGLSLSNSAGAEYTYCISFFDNRPIFYHDGEKICQYLVSDNKQDIITDLDTIRSNASAGVAKVSNVQSDWNATTGLAEVLNKPNMNDYVSKTELTQQSYLKSFTETDPTVPTYVKSITESDITNWNSKTSNVGTITGVKMNGVSKGTSGIVDLGTVITEHQNLDNYVTIVDLSSQAYLTSFTETDPTVPTYVKNITETDITNWNSKTSNTGTITGITMNGVSKGTSGVVDLGTVITSHQSLDDYATKTYVGNKFSELVNSAPDTLNTLNELAAALGNDPNFATTVSTEIGTKVSRDELSGLGYVTQTTLSSQAYLQSFTETDPVFTASAAHSISSTDISNWNDKVSKQYLEEQAYLQSFTETDPTVPTYVKNIKESNISNWNAYQTNVIETISVNSSNITPVGKNINIIIPTLSKGTTSGNGNAVTDISVNSHEITLTKGATFLESHQSIKSLNNVSLSGSTDNITLTIVKEQTPESGFLATYKLKQGDTQIGASINIPKDYLIKSGEVKTVTAANTPYNGAAVGDKYLDFTVNVNEGTASDTHMYIPVNDLVDVYTEGNGIDISSSNVVSIQIDSTNANGLETTSNGLKLNLASGSSAGAMSSSDFTKLSGIPSINSANNGQILQVVNGAWTLVSPVTVYTGSDAPNNNNGNNGDIYLQS